MSEKRILLGNEAIARGAYEAGVKVSAAYPGTPSTEVSESLVQYDEIYAEWAPNEKVATEVAIGASIAGVRSMCVMKHVGMNVAADPLYTAAYTGVRGGLVLVVADDPGMYSSQNEQDSRMVARAAMVPIVEPSDSAEAKEFMKYAYDLSEKYDTPVILRSTTRLSHSQGLVELEERAEPFDIPYERDMAKYVMMPGNAIKRHVVVEARMKQMAEDANSLPINRVEYNDLSVGFITNGIAYQYVKEAMPQASVLKLGYEMKIISAHREPDVFFDYAKSAEERGFKVIIAGAGMAAHLPGMCAAIFPMPVIGIPMHTTSLGGRDSLYSIVQMPSGIPVATVAINGGANAGLLAAKILATSDPELLAKLKEYSQELKEQVEAKDARLQEVGYQNY